MSMYQESPNIVKVVVRDESGTEERFVVGKDLGQVMALISTAFGAESTVAKDKPKTKRTRRTKAQIEAAEDAKEDAANTGPQTDAPPPHSKSKSIWPED